MSKIVNEACNTFGFTLETVLRITNVLFSIAIDFNMLVTALASDFLNLTERDLGCGMREGCQGMVGKRIKTCVSMLALHKTHFAKVGTSSIEEWSLRVGYLVLNQSD